MCSFQACGGHGSTGPGGSQRIAPRTPAGEATAAEGLVLGWRDENDDGDFLDANETLYYCQDANFNTTALVNTSGTVVERYVYDPYGKVTIYDDDWSDTRTSSDYANEVLYAGYRYDTESGLYHVRHRMYHPTLGRWIQRDPIGYGDAMGLYGYARSDPAGLRDPLGLEAPKREEFGYRALTWDDFTPGAIDGDAWASVATELDETFGELDEIPCVCVDDKYCSGTKPSRGSHCYQCFTSWKTCTRVRAVVDPARSRKDLSTGKLGGASNVQRSRLLRHEQGHFRNAEAVARLANTELETDCKAAIAYYFWGDWAAPRKAEAARWKIVYGIINRARTRLPHLDATYDSETNHGVNRESQRKWNEYFQSDAGFATWAPGWVTPK